MRINKIETGVLIVGGGMAAMRAAIAAADAGVDVVVVSKAPAAKSGASTMAGGGITAAMGLKDPADNPEVHFEDTMKAGKGLADPELVRITVEEAPARIQDLIDYGVHFIRKDGELVVGHAPGHSYFRTLHTTNSGAGFVNPLRRKMLSYPNVHLYDDVMAVRLFKDNGHVNGALCLDIRNGELLAVASGATIMATGGYQDIYPASSASSDVTGDGYVMAFDVGAELFDMEILLYYPTALLSPSSLKGALIMYEMYLAAQGIGARLVNIDGDDLLEQYEKLPVRDELSRRIFDEVARGKGTERGGVFLDVSRSHLPMPERIERVKRMSGYKLLTSVGFNVAESKFEVGPAAHTVLGGIRINSRCESTVPGLYAAGEAAGNIHGANRLGGNALTDTQVFGFRAGHYAAQFAMDNGKPRISNEALGMAARPVLTMVERKEDRRDVLDVKNAIRQTMFKYVGPTRNDEGISLAIQTIENILAVDVPMIQVQQTAGVYNYALVEALEADFMARVATLVCRAASLRKESRGHHYRSDYPTTDDEHLPCRTLLCQRGGALLADLHPVC